MTDRAAPRWKTTDWRGHPNYVCMRNQPNGRPCPFATLDIGLIRVHAAAEHPLASEGRPERHPLEGVPFASDEAAEAAIAAGLTSRAFEQLTPSGRSGGYTVADVRSAAKTT